MYLHNPVYLAVDLWSTDFVESDKMIRLKTER